MRILVFSTDDFLPPAGGAETSIFEIARRNTQHRFTLVCARLEASRKWRETVGNVEIFRIGVGSRRIDAFLLAFFGGFIGIAMHLRERFNLVWAVMASYGAAGATIFSWATGVPFLMTLQEGNDVQSGVRAFPVLRWIYRLGFRSADGLHAISKYLLEWGLRMGFQANRPMELIPNGVDIKLFTSELPDGAIVAERASYHVPENAFVITTISRLVPKNGVGDIISALSLLPPRFVLIIYGLGRLRAQLESMAEKFGVAGRVRFMGQLARERLPVALRAADVFVRPSLTEGLGTAFLEAMAAGTPVIATPVGGIVDFIHDGKNGFFTPPGDPSQLARTVERVAATDSGSLTSIKEQAFNTVFRNYNWDDIARRMDNLFHRVCRI